jgi:hypothetical protein
VIYQLAIGVASCVSALCQDRGQGSTNNVQREYLIPTNISPMSATSIGCDLYLEII